MGWDAHSSAKVDWQTKKLVDPGIDEIFKQAEKQALEKAGVVDGYLHIGGLDLSASAYALEKATGESCWNPEGWTAEQVKALWAAADWHTLLPSDEFDLCGYWSAYYFLEACAKADLSISFSW